MATEKTVKCPECDKDVKLTDGEGTCANCGLDVGWVVEKARRERAVRRLLEPETPPRKRKGFLEF